MYDTLALIGLLFLGSIAGLSGGLALILSERATRAFSVHLIAFAAGVILATAFLDLLPEAIEVSGEGILAFALIGLVAFFLIEDFFLHFHHHEGHSHPLRSAVPLIVGSDSIHNFIDGAVISASFMADPKLGLVVAVATFFHEIPQEVGDFAVLLSSGVSKVRTIFYNLASAVATFLGAGATLVATSASEVLIGPLLALATGMFIYIASVDILPRLVQEQGKGERIKTAFFFLIGILATFLLTKALPG